MDLFDQELIAFWKALNTHGVKYIMVGGVTTNLHGYHRTTKDADIWIKDTIENRGKLRAALKNMEWGIMI